jgi:outer membrane protein OmpA-like peptidoglycan-associated protein
MRARGRPLAIGFADRNGLKGYVPRALVLLVCVVLAASACGTPVRGGRTGESRGSGGSGTAAQSGTRAGRQAAPEPTSCPNGGQLIRAVVIPAVHADPVHIPERTIGGQKIPAVTVPGVDLPAQRVPAQCVDIKPAPGGCLGAVSIPPVSIPATRLPAAEIPGVRAGGINLPAVRVDAREAPAQYAKGVSTGEVCQITPQRGRLVPSVLRPSILRANILRPSILRPSMLRPSACNGNRECIPAVHVPAVNVPAVNVPAVTVRAALLRSRLIGRSEVIEGRDTVAYNVKADVLFDFDKATIKPGAAAELRRIAEAIKTEVPAGARIQVDGHTDGKGGPGYNRPLSERRAQAVVEWLVTEGGIDRGRLAARGYGETKPLASNTKADGSDNPAGRAKNRRVVISARRG